MLAGCGAAHGAGLEHLFGACFHHLAVGVEHPGFHLLARQGAQHEPGAAFEEGDAAAIVAQALDVQALFLAGGYLHGALPARGLEAQADVLLSHQLVASKMPLDR